MDAESKAIIIEAENKGKPQTVIYNGIDMAGITTNAVNAFTSKDFKAAFIAAREMLASNADNIVALYIIAFEDYAIKKKMFSMDNFFSKLSDVTSVATREDIESLEKMFLVSTMKLEAYEEQVLRFEFETNGNDIDKADAVCSFVDRFSPYLITSRTNHKFLTNELEALYSEFSMFCNIPKTCYALIGGIQNNPESPLKNEQYYLKERNIKFYNEYVVKVGAIISKMKSDKYRTQFTSAYEKSRAIHIFCDVLMLTKNSHIAKINYCVYSL